MEHYPVQDNRRSRLGQLSAEWGVTEQSPPVSPLPRPEPRSFRTDNDELYAEEMRRPALRGDADLNNPRRLDFSGESDPKKRGY